MLSQEEIKQKVGAYAARFVEPGMTIGLGTGSTVLWLIRELEDRVKQGLEVSVVPTSVQTSQLADTAGIPVADLEEVDELALTIDGADEIDPHGRLIKGGGGALLREKIVAAASRKLIIIADHTKSVSKLGKFALPVEVIPFGYRQVCERILALELAASVTLRKKNGYPFVTDHWHYIVDCQLNSIGDAEHLNQRLQVIPGVVETGLFIGMTNMLVLGNPDGTVQEINY